MAKNILVVEDDNIIRQSLCEILRNGGYEVTEAIDGNQCVELLTKHRFDLVVTDYILPKLHGFYMVNMILSNWPGLPIIVISGFLSPRAAKDLMRDLSVDFVHKPVEPDTLLSKVKNHLRPSQSAPP